MPLNIKHQIAIALGTAASAVCLIGFLKSDSNEQDKPLTTVEQLSELNTRLSSGEIPNNSVPIVGLKALPPAPENQFPVVASSRTQELELAPEMSDDAPHSDITLMDEHSFAPEAESDLIDAPPTLTNFQPLQLASPESNVQLSASTSSEPITTQQSESVAPETALKKTVAPIVARPGWTANPHIHHPVETTLNDPVATTLNHPVAATPSHHEQNGHISSLLELERTAKTVDKTSPTPAHSVIARNNVSVPTSTPLKNSTMPGNNNHSQSTLPSVDPRITPVQMNLSETSALQAVHHIEYGKSLSRRGAAYAAQQEFFAALRVIAQANDSVVGGNDFSQALTNAVRTLKEAEDFTVAHSANGAVVNVAATVESHQTKLFTESEAKRATAVEAMQRYYSFAEQQLDFAGGRNVVTAEALSCLGKLHSVMARHKKTMPGNLDIAKAIVFHKTSLLSNPNNAAAANELGVLMAKTGQLDVATNLFKQSLIAKATPQAWQNLAKTHHQLGELEMARLAETELALAAQASGTQGDSGIQWIQVPQFNAMAPMEFEPRVATQTQPVQPLNITKSEATEPEKEAPKSLTERIKGWF